MKRRMNGRAVLIVLMTALLLFGAVGGTMAYLQTQTEEVKNTFEPTAVPSEVEETLSGNVKTDVKIRNNGNISAYIRAAIVVTWKNAEGMIYPQNPIKNTDYEISIGSGWTEKDGYYYYNASVEAGGTTDNLIETCKPLEGKAPDGYFLNVEILGQAIQAEGMGNTVTNAQTAFAAAKSGN